jgi:hypothetical protein
MSQSEDKVNFDSKPNEEYEFTAREVALLIFSLGRVDNLMGLLATKTLSINQFTKEECRDLAKKLGAKIVVGDLDS